MDTFFTLLKKGMVATIFTIFAFVGTYTPQVWNDVEYAHAGGGLSGGATEPTQILNKLELIPINISDAISAAKNTLVAGYTWLLQNKELVLDGIAWYAAKAVVQSMVQSLINWINSGFEGSPAFVQDLEGFLRNAADEAIGEYIQELGALGSFICDPFRLDVQIAVALEYQRTRVNQPAPTCTLTGIIDNLDGFLSGEPGSFNQGGWNDWFDVTSQPESYTPYGAVLSGQTGATLKILNTKGEEAAKLEWGDGFLSGEICNLVSGADVTTEECFISKPGKIIEEALSFNLDSGRQSLITADEINEIIAALLGQLANTAITGVAGLLGVGTSASSPPVYPDFDPSYYLDSEAVRDDAISSSLTAMQDALSTQSSYLALATNIRPQLVALINDPNTDIATTISAENALAEVDAVIANTPSNISTLNVLISDYGALGNSTTPTDSAERSDILSAFNNLSLYSEYQIEASEASWNDLLN
jgi:hypothetical protein